jgi:hypothetical protein
LAKAVSKHIHQASKYQKVVDGRKRPMRGFWISGSRFKGGLQKHDEAAKERVLPNGVGLWLEFFKLDFFYCQR